MNPFSTAIMPDAWAEPVADVPTIHGRVSRQIADLIERVRQGAPAASLLFHGVAGSGKTHLLARLHREITSAQPEPAVFCCVRMATSPNIIRRHLRRALVRDLTRPDTNGITQLDRGILAAMAPRPAVGDVAAQLAEIRGNRDAWREARQRCGSFFRDVGLSFNVTRACGWWMFGRHRGLVAEWLAGGDLGESASRRLGLRDDSVAIEDDPERAAADVIGQLIRLIGGSGPLVLCFDQVEALQVAPDDTTGYFAFGKMVADLFDGGGGLVLVTAAQSLEIERIRGAIAASDLHRLTQHEVVLDPLDEQQATALIQARVRASGLAPPPDIEPTDPRWPLDEDTLATFMANPDRTPRQLLLVCREQIEGSGRAVDPAMHLVDLLEERLERAAEGVDDAQATIIHGLEQVVAARGRFAVSTVPARQYIDSKITRGERCIALSVCNQQGNSLPARLRRILREPLEPGEERVVLRSADLPIPKTSRKAREYFNAIENDERRDEAGRKRLRTLRVSPEAVAMLEAVRTLLGDSRAGDLTADGRTIPVATVEAWIRDQLLEPIEELLAGVEHGAGGTAEGPTVAIESQELRDAVLETLQERHLLRLDELATLVDAAADAIVGIVRNEPDVFGSLGDATAVVYQRVVAGGAVLDDAAEDDDERLEPASGRSEPQSLPR